MYEISAGKLSKTKVYLFRLLAYIATKYQKVKRSKSPVNFKLYRHHYSNLKTYTYNFQLTDTRIHLETGKYISLISIIIDNAVYNLIFALILKIEPHIYYNFI